MAQKRRPPCKKQKEQPLPQFELSPPPPFSSPPQPQERQQQKQLLLGLSPPQSPSKLVSYDGTVYEFPDQPPQKFICSICTQLVKDPHLTACCGQEFCGACLEQWKANSKKTTCPHCRQERFVHILNKQSRREVDETVVYCSKRIHGCNWKGELKSVHTHLTDCGFVLFKCDNCLMSVTRQHYDKHMTSDCPNRFSKCEYCGKEDTYLKVISFVHRAECPGYPMGCPNNCGAAGIKRCEMQKHREECPLEEIDCPMKSAGCSVGRIQRKQLGPHVEEYQSQHLLYLMSAFEHNHRQLEDQQRELKELKMFKVTTSHVIEQMTSTVDKLTEKALTTQLGPLRSITALLGSAKSLSLDSNNPKLSLVVPNLSQLEKKQVPSWNSPPFFLEPSYKVCLVLQRGLSSSSNDIGAELRLLRGEFDYQINWPCSVDFSKIFISLSQDEKLTKTNSPTAKKATPPFSLSSRGQCHTDLAQCVSSENHRLLWRTDKLIDPLPPYPSSLRNQYIHNDCLTITLTLQSQPVTCTSRLNSRFLNLSLRQRNSIVSNGAESVTGPDFNVSVSTATSSSPSRMLAIIRRKKS